MQKQISNLYFVNYNLEHLHAHFILHFAKSTATVLNMLATAWGQWRREGGGRRGSFPTHGHDAKGKFSEIN